MERKYKIGRTVATFVFLSVAMTLWIFDTTNVGFPIWVDDALQYFAVIIGSPLCHATYVGGQSISERILISAKSLLCSLRPFK